MSSRGAPIKFRNFPETWRILFVVKLQVLTEAVAWRCFPKAFSKTFRKIHRKMLLLLSFLSKPFLKRL